MERNPNSILKEQLQLVKAQKEIDKMIQLINECLNEFLVENLQIKSNEVARLISDSDMGGETTMEPPCELSEEKVNTQSLNLDIAKSFKCEIIEEEEEDEEDDREISSLSFLD